MDEAISGSPQSSRPLSRFWTRNSAEPRGVRQRVLGIRIQVVHHSVGVVEAAAVEEAVRVTGS